MNWTEAHLLGDLEAMEKSEMTDPIKRNDAPEPCPFCRSPAKTQELVEDLWVVWCVECKAQMENFATEAEAIAAWNTRALPAAKVKPLYFGGQGDPFVATQEDGVEYTIKDAGNWWEWADNIGHWGRGYGSQEGAMFGAEAQDLARLHSTLELTPAIDPAIDPAAIREAALEAKLTKAVEALQAAKVYIADLQNHEGAEGFSASTNQAADNYHTALAELEGKE